MRRTHASPPCATRAQDDVPSFDDKVAFEILEQQLGRPIDQVYSSISSQTIAAASLGQVGPAALDPARGCATRARIKCRVQGRWTVGGSAPQPSSTCGTLLPQGRAWSAGPGPPVASRQPKGLTPSPRAEGAAPYPPPDR